MAQIPQQKILLIDKHANGMTAIEQAFASEQYRLVPTASPREGLLKLGNERFDLIISECSSSGGSKLELFKTFANYRKRSESPLVLFGGGAEELQFLREQELTNLHHLQKLATREEIREAIEAILGRPASGAAKKVAPAGAGINVEFVNPVLQATITTIGTMTEYTVTPGRPYLKRPSDVSGDISGIVNVVSGGFNGTISLSFAERTYLRVVARILKTEYERIDQQNSGSVGELINIIFGQAKSILSTKGHKFQPALPSIIASPGHSVDHKSPHPPIAIDFNVADVGSLKVEICRAS
ncbi:MAG: chemotaxis protein CheX [Oligoflexia bacterium]|nr:chemotaxis protein CheX [Oligoflexia bacterium]